MALLPTLVEARNVTRTSGSLDVFNDFWYGVTGGPTKSGVTISEKTALKYLTVARCVMLISADLARLPLILYRRMSDGSKIQMVDHPLFDILKNDPNSETNSFQWRESGNGHVELWGNHYSEILRDKYTGDVKALVQLTDPGVVTVKRNDKGVILYKWQDKKGLQTRRRDQMFHVPGFGFNGLVGLSVISMIRESIGLGMANDEFASRYFGQGMNIGAVINVPHPLGDSKDEYLKALQKQYAGLKSSHGLLVTENDETFTQLKMPLKDAQFLEGREFQKAEIAGFYGVPGHKVGIYKQNTNRNNTEQENQGYLDSCLIHRITRYETCISQQLLTKKDRQFGLFVEFNVTGLLRADSQARAEFYNKIFQVGGISPNEIRAKENMNPDDSPAANQKYVMLNMVPLDMAGDLAAPKPEGKSQRSIEKRGGIVVRDRIAKQYYPLFTMAAEKIVNLETNAIKRKVEGYRKQRAKPEMKSWLESFYKDLPERIKREIGPVFQSFASAVVDASATEIGIDATELEMKKFISDYIDTYALRHTSSSLGQMVALLDGELDDLATRADEWRESRPEKIARNETVQASSAVFAFVAFGAGLSLVWRIRGSKTCPYCTSLNGARVAKGGSFVSAGDEIDPKDGTGPMRFWGLKQHPPLHQGCDCYVTAG